MKDVISKELLSKVLGLKVWKVLECDTNTLRYCICPNKDADPSEYIFSINIHELTHKCIIYAWGEMYDISPRVMGAVIYAQMTIYQLHIVQREDLENPKPFDPRFTFKACQWLLDNKGI